MEDITTTLHDANGETHEYAMLPFPALKGRKLYAKFAKVAAPVFGLLGESFMNGTERFKLDSSSIKQALIPAIDLLMEDDQYMFDLLATVRRDGVKLVKTEIDKQYTGNYGELLLAMWWVLEAQFLAPLLKSLLGVNNEEAVLKRLTTKFRNYTKEAE